MKLIGFALLAIPCASAAAQAPADTLQSIPVDTALVKTFSSINPGAAKPGPITSTKSPAVAMLLSAILPGAGQAYNESYWKVPVVLGFGVYFASLWLHNNRLASEYRDRYSESITPSLPEGDSRLLAVRDFYKNQRDTFTWYFAILYFLNIADAYVDASLYDFNVSDNLSIKLIPDSGTRLTLRVSF